MKYEMTSVRAQIYIKNRTSLGAHRVTCTSMYLIIYYIRYLSKKKITSSCKLENLCRIHHLVSLRISVVHHLVSSCKIMIPVVDLLSRCFVPFNQTVVLGIRIETSLDKLV
jgi:hypothetical protein